VRVSLCCQCADVLPALPVRVRGTITARGPSPCSYAERQSPHCAFLPGTSFCSVGSMRRVCQIRFYCCISTVHTPYTVNSTGIRWPGLTTYRSGQPHPCASHKQWCTHACAPEDMCTNPWAQRCSRTGEEQDTGHMGTRTQYTRTKIMPTSPWLRTLRAPAPARVRLPASGPG